MKQGVSRRELYDSFTQFIQGHTQRERRQLNRRILNIFIWCFVFPVFFSLLGMVLLKRGILPVRVKNYVDSLILFFPILYSIYFLFTEVLKGLPNLFRQGGISTVLAQSVRETEWRAQVSAELIRTVQADQADWVWIIQNFRADLDAFIFRIRYLTALSGAVFFLLMQGVELLGENPTTYVRLPTGAWAEQAMESDPSRWAALGIFLMLFYLSGSYSHAFLKRYLTAAELIEVEK